MTLRAWTFALTHYESGDLVAIAVVCPEDQYVTAMWVSGRTDRYQATSGQWQAIGRELDDGVGKTPLPAGSVLLSLLASNASLGIQVRCLNVRDVTIARPSDAARALDTVLREQAP